MAVDEAHEVRQTSGAGPGLWWRGSDWWRGVALLYAVIAVACAVPILTYSVGYWLPCFGEDYDSPACLEIQDHDIVGAFTYDRISGFWLVALVAAVVTAGLCWRAGVPRSLVLDAPLLLLVANPIGDYVITPMINGGYASHDAHPASGIPMGAAVAVAGLAAVVAAVTGGPRPVSGTSAAPR